jgi:hypothetical protein
MPRVPFIDPETPPADKRAALEFSQIKMKYVLAHATDTFVPMYQAVPVVLTTIHSNTERARPLANTRTRTTRHVTPQAPGAHGRPEDNFL